MLHKNNNSRVIPRLHVTATVRVLQHTSIGFHISRVIHIKTLQTLSGVRTVFCIFAFYCS